MKESITHPTGSRWTMQDVYDEWKVHTLMAETYSFHYSVIACHRVTSKQWGVDGPNERVIIQEQFKMRASSVYKEPRVEKGVESYA